MTAERMWTSNAGRLFRAVLAKAFPGKRFGIRCKSFSMGWSVDITCPLGVTVRETEAAIAHIGAKGFDGMTDSTIYPAGTWTAPDGSVWDRCSAWVNVEQSPEAAEAMSLLYVGAVEAAMREIPDGSTALVRITPWAFVGRCQHGRITVRLEDLSQPRSVQDFNEAKHAAYFIAASEPKQMERIAP